MIGTDTVVIITDPQLRSINRGLNNAEHLKRINKLLEGQVDTLERISTLKDSALTNQQKILEIQQYKAKLAMENIEELKQAISRQNKKKIGTIIKSTAIGAAVGIVIGMLIMN